MKRRVQILQLESRIIVSEAKMDINMEFSLA